MASCGIKVVKADFISFIEDKLSIRRKTGAKYRQHPYSQADRKTDWQGQERSRMRNGNTRKQKNKNSKA